MTIDQLVEKSGVPRSTLMRILAATRHINTDQLGDLADALDMDMAALVKKAVDRLDEDPELYRGEGDNVTPFPKPLSEAADTSDDAIAADERGDFAGEQETHNET